MFSCNISCNGLYADVQHQNREAKNDEMFNTIQKSYKSYKNSFAQNIEFYQDSNTEIDFSTFDHYIYDNGFVKEFPDLIFVDIFFDTATYDKIKRDVKVKDAWLLKFWWISRKSPIKKSLPMFAIIKVNFGKKIVDKFAT